MLLISVIYIAWFSMRLFYKFAPCLAAAADERAVMKPPRVSVIFIVGTLIYAAAWAYVLSVSVTMMY